MASTLPPHTLVSAPQVTRSRHLRNIVATVLLALTVAPILAFAQAGTDAVYRFYNRQSGAHFYTIALAERDRVVASYPQFAYEGPMFGAWTAATTATVPVYRFYNKNTGTHFYTVSAAERDKVIATYPQFVFEGPGWHALATPGSDGRVGVYRFFNKNTGTHFYTVSVTERDKVLASYPQFVDEGIAFYVFPSAATAAPPVVVRSSDGWRLLEQSTFGATPAALAHVNAVGTAAYLEEQFAQAPSGYPDAEYYYQSLDEAKSCSFAASRSSAAYICAHDQLTLFRLRNQFFVNALTKPDQLRQRVAWALSQFFVVSGMKDPDMETAYVQARYHQILFDEAFGNFESLLTRVTLSPQMGHYLDMVDNAKADPVAKTEPNENFARELLQLFSIGTVELKDDGTPILDAKGVPVPTYGQAEIKAFSRAFTGWTYAAFDAAQEQGPDDRRYFARPMVPVANAHDTGAKTLLKSTALPAGQNADTDLKAALRNVFMHPNVGPYFAQHLIRQMVTGNPTPAYVGRVAAAFNNNGKGTRGDMKAVLRAVLLDAEARGDARTDPRYGLLKEPVLFVTGMLRQLDAASDGNRLYEPARAMGQDVYYSPSVFNYYPADYTIPGTTIVAPQFGIHNTNTVLHRANFAHEMIDDGGWGPDNELAGAIGTKVDLRPYHAVAADPAQLVTLVNTRLFGGGMPLGIRDEIYQAIAAFPADSTTERARAAVFLAITSFQYQVQR